MFKIPSLVVEIREKHGKMLSAVEEGFSPHSGRGCPLCCGCGLVYRGNGLSRCGPKGFVFRAGILRRVMDLRRNQVGNQVGHVP